MHSSYERCLEIQLLHINNNIIIFKDSVLFHNTIGYNINYGNLLKTQNDVENAAKMAEIHDSILRWPKQYETEVYMLLGMRKKIKKVIQFLGR